jgi:hypothetical protein
VAIRHGVHPSFSLPDGMHPEQSPSVSTETATV